MQHSRQHTPSRHLGRRAGLAHPVRALLPTDQNPHAQRARCAPAQRPVAGQQQQRPRADVGEGNDGSATALEMPDAKTRRAVACEASGVFRHAERGRDIAAWLHPHAWARAKGCGDRSFAQGDCVCERRRGAVSVPAGRGGGAGGGCRGGGECGECRECRGRGGGGGAKRRPDHQKRRIFAPHGTDVFGRVPGVSGTGQWSGERHARGLAHSGDARMRRARGAPVHLHSFVC